MLIICCFAASALTDYHLQYIFPDHNLSVSATLIHSSPSLTEVWPPSLQSPIGREPSAATGPSPAEDSRAKCTHQGAQEVPFMATAGV